MKVAFWENMYYICNNEQQTKQHHHGYNGKTTPALS